MPIDTQPTSTAPTNARLPPDDARARARQLIGRALGFDTCAADVLDELVAAGQLKHLRSGEFAARRGDRNGFVCMVVSGLLEGSALQSDGHRHLVGLLPPGEFSGLLGLVNTQRHPHDLTAREATTLLAVPNHEMHLLRDKHPAIVLACELQIARRMQMLYERLFADPGMPLETRVANMLVTVGRLYGHAVGPHIELEFKLSQADLADWVGLSRQRVNFALKRLESERLIRLHYSTLTITDPAGLEARAEH